MTSPYWLFSITLFRVITLSTSITLAHSYLKVNGLTPITISLDDYFLNREDTPLDEFGKYDFESIYAIDLERFNSDLKNICP